MAWINRCGQYFQIGRDLAGSAVFELDLGFDELMALALEQRIDQHRILLGNKGPAYFTGAGKFVVVWVKLFVQDKKARHLRAGRPRIVGQASGRASWGERGY